MRCGSRRWALHKGVEEGNLAPHLGVAIGRGFELFTEYLPRHLYPISKIGFARRQAFRSASI